MRSLVLSCVFCLWSGITAAQTLTWSPGPNLPNTQHLGTAVVMPNGTAVALGGTNEPFPAWTLFPGGVSWLNGPNLDEVRSGLIAAPVGDRVLVIGGSYSETRAIIYDPSINDFTDLPGMANHTFGATAVDALGRVYAIGGAGPSSVVERFDAQTNSWTTLAPLSGARYFLTAASDGGDRVFAFGGLTAVNGAAVTTTVFRYTVSTDSWSPAAPMLMATSGAAAVLAPDGKIYVLGGSNGYSISNAVQVYDPVANTWSMGTPLPEGFAYGGAGLDALGRIVVVGGQNALNNDTTSVWVSNPISGLPDSPPVVTSSPVTTATALSPYTYRATASGQPAPRFTLLAGPVGMTIDSVSGVVSWTPSAEQLGPNDVTIGAANALGAVTQSFTISCIAPPPTTPGAFAASQITSKGATLSWEASTTLVGTVTYTVKRYLGTSGRPAVAHYQTLVSGLTATSFNVTGLSPGTSYLFHVSATVVGTGTSGTAAVSLTTLIPPTPLGLTASNITQSGVTLTWTEPSAGPGNSALVGYRVYQDGARLAGDFTTTTMSVTALTPGSTHTFQIVSADSLGSESMRSNGVVITALSPPVIKHAAVYGEQVVAVVGGGLMVVQTTTSAVGVPYTVSSVSLPAPVFSVLAGPPGMTVDPLTGVVTWSPADGPTGTFTATIRGTNSQGTGDLTFSYRVYAAGTDLLAPAAPAITGVVYPDSTSATVSWVEPADDVAVTGYRIYKATSIPARGTPIYTLIATVPAPAASYRVTGLLTNYRASIGVVASMRQGIRRRGRRST
jgi:hypothetical protein